VSNKASDAGEPDLSLLVTSEQEAVSLLARLTAPDVSSMQPSINALLLLAVDRNYGGLAKHMIKGGLAAASSSRSGDGATPLLIACARGHTDLAVWLAEQGGARLDLERTAAGSSGIILTVQHGHVAILCALCRAYTWMNE
jgi:hypothetical protein